MPSLSAITIYPIKGVAGLSLDQATVEKRGLQHDRRFLIVDSENQFLSQRELSMLATIDAVPTPDGLDLRFRGGDSINVRFPNGHASRMEVTVWYSVVSAVDCGDEIAEWLSRGIGRSVRLTCMDQASKRMPGKGAEPGDEVSFADACPILLANEASLEELNGRLTDPVPINRFRPNLVISGADAWMEDDWTSLQIGDLRFRAVANCKRCHVTTIDQATGKKTGQEPLRTLAGYRTIDGGAVFGRYLIPDSLGTIRVGDPVSGFCGRRP